MSLFNIGSIQKIEITLSKNIYLFYSQEQINLINWVNLPISPLSASLDMPDKISKSGKYFEMSLSFLIPKICPENSQIIIPYIGIPVAFRITDANGTVIIMGSFEYPAYMNSNGKIPQRPEGYNGYNLSASCDTTTIIAI